MVWLLDEHQPGDLGAITTPRTQAHDLGVASWAITEPRSDLAEQTIDGALVLQAGEDQPPRVAVATPR